MQNPFWKEARAGRSTQDMAVRSKATLFDSSTNSNYYKVSLPVKELYVKGRNHVQ